MHIHHLLCGTPCHPHPIVFFLPFWGLLHRLFLLSRLTVAIPIVRALTLLTTPPPATTSRQISQANGSSQSAEYCYCLQSIREDRVHHVAGRHGEAARYEVSRRKTQASRAGVASYTLRTGLATSAIPSPPLLGYRNRRCGEAFAALQPPRVAAKPHMTAGSRAAEPGQASLDRSMTLVAQQTREKTQKKSRAKCNEVEANSQFLSVVFSPLNNPNAMSLPRGWLQQGRPAQTSDAPPPATHSAESTASAGAAL